MLSANELAEIFACVLLALVQLVFIAVTSALLIGKNNTVSCSLHCLLRTVSFFRVLNNSNYAIRIERAVQIYRKTNTKYENNNLNVNIVTSAN